MHGKPDRFSKFAKVLTVENIFVKLMTKYI